MYDFKRRGSGPLIAGAAAAAVIAGSFGIAQLAQPGRADASPHVASGATASAGTTFLITCAHEAVSEPVNFDLLCGNGTYALDDVRWSSWGGRTARAEGRYVEKDCTPTCAQGALISYPVKIVATQRKSQDGVSSYQDVTLTFTGKQPDWVKGGTESYDMTETGHTVGGAK